MFWLSKFKQSIEILSEISQLVEPTLPDGARPRIWFDWRWEMHQDGIKAIEHQQVVLLPRIKFFNGLVW